MELTRVDTQRAYKAIRELITTLELSPGSPIDEAKLADKLGVGLVPVREAIKLLIHDHLIEAPSMGLFVAELKIIELRQISELRLLLEPYCVRQTAKLATADDLLVLEALCKEQSLVPTDQPRALIELDHKFHQAIARASQNKYLVDILEHLFGLSQRVWFMALPHLKFLPAAVESHLELVAAIKAQDEHLAEELMRQHIQDFYVQVFAILQKLDIQ
ncbi:MAG: GntR family transcriptional regulator [Chloroflexi bacterium]|nr:GntR family transcriptional regulator [Chloroflexota bacterium]